MSILNFVSQEDLDDLDEDPRIAFMTLVGKARHSLSQQLSHINPEAEDGWEEREELRHSFMNVIIAAAKRFEIEPFLSMQVPKFVDFKRDVDHREFQADLDHYVTQLTLDNSIRSKHDSVAMLPDTKERIRAYLNGLRQCIEKSQMSEGKREALLERLDIFEAELDRKRLNILAVARLTFELLAVPGGLWASADITNKLIHNVMQTVAETRSVEREHRRLPPDVPPKALSPPRYETFSKGGGRMTEIIDDEIPF